jgi:alanyl-tRNA synthetase
MREAEENYTARQHWDQGDWTVFSALGQEYVLRGLIRREAHQYARQLNESTCVGERV